MEGWAALEQALVPVLVAMGAADVLAVLVDDEPALVAWREPAALVLETHADGPPPEDGALRSAGWSEVEGAWRWAIDLPTQRLRLEQAAGALVDAARQAYGAGSPDAVRVTAVASGPALDAAFAQLRRDLAGPARPLTPLLTADEVRAVLRASAGALRWPTDLVGLDAVIDAALPEAGLRRTEAGVGFDRLRSARSSAAGEVWLGEGRRPRRLLLALSEPVEPGDLAGQVGLDDLAVTTRAILDDELGEPAGAVDDPWWPVGRMVASVSRHDRWASLDLADPAEPT